MTYEEKKAWLRRYRHAVRMEELKLEEVEQLCTAAQRVTQVLSSMPGGQGDGQSIPRAVERIEDARQEALAQVERCTQIRSEITHALDQVQNITDYEILTRRYIRRQKWEQIAVEMRMDFRWITRRHHIAVDGLTLESPIPNS